MKVRSLSLFILIVFSGLSFPVIAQEDAFRSTEYPLPRFVSLSDDEVNVRSGPGQKYPVKWIFKKRFLPVEIILEYDNWRKIRDHEGESGWVHKSLLSGKRSALIRGDNLVAIYRKPKQESRLIAYFEPNVVGLIEECRRGWCRVEASGYEGWINRSNIWGVYDSEDFD